MGVKCSQCGSNTKQRKDENGEIIIPLLCFKCSPVSKAKHAEAVKKYRASEKGKQVTYAVNRKSRTRVKEEPVNNQLVAEVVKD